MRFASSTVERGNHLVVYPAQLELFLSENDHLTVSAIDIDSESNWSFSGAGLSA